MAKKSYITTTGLSVDAHDIYEMLLRYRQESPDANKVPLNFEAVKRSFDLVVHDRLGFVRVILDSNEEMQGVLWAIAQPSAFSDLLIASTVIFRVEPVLAGTRASRDLVDAYKQWTSELGAINTLTIFDKRTGKMLERLGYVFGEMQYYIPQGGGDNDRGVVN